MKSILFSLTLVFTALACFAQDYYGNNRKQWLQKAEQYKPKLIITEKKPLKVVDIVPDTQSFQKYKAVDVSPIDSLYSMPFRLKKEITIDFGEHLTGYFRQGLYTMEPVPLMSPSVHRHKHSYSPPRIDAL